MFNMALSHERRQRAVRLHVEHVGRAGIGLRDPF